MEVAQRDGAQAAARLIGTEWDHLAHTDPAQLQAAMRVLPGEIFIDNPGLLVAANYLQQLTAEAVPARFESGPQLTAPPPDQENSLASQLILLTGATAAERTRGNFAAAKNAALDARQRLDAASDSDVAPFRENLPHLMLQWGRSLETGGGESGHLAHREYEEAHRIASLTDQPQIQRRAAGHLAWHLAERGYLTGAEPWLRRAESTGQTNRQYDAVIHLTSALLHVDRHERAAAAVDFAHLSEHPIGDYWAAALWVQAAYAHSAAERTMLETDITSAMERLAPSVTSGTVNAYYLQAAWWRLGRLKPRGGPVLDSAAAYRRGDFRAAIEISRPATGPESNPRRRAAALLLSAAATLGLGRATAALTEFERAYAIIERERIYTTYELVDASHLEALATGLGVAIPSPALLRSDSDASLLVQLSKRERQVLGLLTTDRSLPTIAGELFVSPNTLKTTVRRLYRKLGVNSRQEAADVAHRAGLHAPR
jgi:DNA-binding CsgD family transcriptional regulator